MCECMNDNKKHKTILSLKHGFWFEITRHTRATNPNYVLFGVPIL